MGRLYVIAISYVLMLVMVFLLVQVRREMRGRSYSPSPPPRHSRRGGGGRSPSPRGRYPPRPRQQDLPTSLLVRNLRHDCRYTWTHTRLSFPSLYLYLICIYHSNERVSNFAGLRIFADLLVNLVLSRTFTFLRITTLGESPLSLSLPFFPFHSSMYHAFYIIFLNNTEFGFN